MKSLPAKNSFIILLLLLTSRTVLSQTYTDEISSYREQCKQNFQNAEQPPIKKEDMHFMRYFPADEVFRVTASFRKNAVPVTMQMATLNGSSKTYLEYGTLSFRLKGKPFLLKVYQPTGLTTDDYLFLPFTDLTNGKETYGGGRYLNLSTVDLRNNQLVVDFNKAYNPYCAYSENYTCPKPPAENDLKIAISAGEKNFGKAIH